MDELRRHRMVFKVLMPFIHIFTKLKFNYEYDRLKEIEGPFLLLANHNMELVIQREGAFSHEFAHDS